MSVGSNLQEMENVTKEDKPKVRQAKTVPFNSRTSTTEDLSVI